MQLWHHIVQVAQLGTEKRLPDPPPPGSPLAAAVSAISNNSAADREDQFLQTAALAFNYRQSGSRPAQYVSGTPQPAPAEDLAHCSPAAHQALKDAITFESIGLLTLWLRTAAAKQKIARPEVLPVLLDTARAQRLLRPLILPVLGRRGAWLAQFNAEWQFTSDQPDEEIWQTAPLPQRRQVLLRTAQSDPATALQWLQGSWAKENAATRAELLKDLPPALFEADIAWLEALLADKSVKVRDEALRLLKLIPTSSVVQQYWQVLQKAVHISTEKTMLGLSSKKVLSFAPPEAFDDAIFKTGIEKTTIVDKSFLSEGEMVLFQLAEHVPPDFWEAHFQLPPKEIFDMFAKDKTGNKFLPSIGMAAYRFGNKDWAPLFTQDESRYFHDILPLLEPALREPYMVKHFDIMTEGIVRYLTEQQAEEWGMQVTRAFFKHAAQNYYQYTRGFYSKFIHLIPVQIAAELDGFSPAEAYGRSGWTDMAGYILQLLSVKTQTLQSFQSIKP